MKNHRLFLSTILTLFTLSVCAQAERIQKRDYNKYANYDESKVPAYTLPDVLLCSDGTRVTTVEEWEQKRRPELFQLFETYMFGKAPAAPSPLIYRVTDTAQKELGGKAIRKLVDLLFSASVSNPTTPSSKAPGRSTAFSPMAMDSPPSVMKTWSQTVSTIIRLVSIPIIIKVPKESLGLMSGELLPLGHGG